MARPPAFQFYTGDWMKDPNLSMCSPATRGIWMDLLCAMHENDRSGRLQGTTEQLARLARCTPAEMADALAELRETGTGEVSEVTVGPGIVTVTSRRMRRDWRDRKSNAERKKRQRSEGSAEVSGPGPDTVTRKSRSPSSVSSVSSASAYCSSETSSPQAQSAVVRPLTSQQQRVKAVLDLWKGIPEGLHPEVGLVVTWLKGWDDDEALIRNLVEAKAAGVFHRGANFVTGNLRVRWQNGKQAPPPLRDKREPDGGTSRYRRLG